MFSIFLHQSKDATPYLERNRLASPNRDAIDAAAALTDMGKYLYLEDRLPAYDMAVVMTKLDMCRKQFGEEDAAEEQQVILTRHSLRGL